MELLNWIASLFTTYGGVNVLIMIAIIILTNLIKRPILAKAESLVEYGKKHNIVIDKSVITSNIVYIPFGLGLIFYSIYALITTGFNFAEVHWDIVVANATLYGAVAQTIYNIGKDKIKAFLSGKAYKEVKKIKLEEEAEIEIDTKNDLIYDDPEFDVCLEDEGEQKTEQEVIEGDKVNE